MRTPDAAHPLRLLSLVALLLVASACDKGGDSASSSTAGDATPGDAIAAQASGQTQASSEPIDTSLRMVTYEWDREAGDPEVPAELGGPGFTGEGWTTNLTFPELGQAGVPQGGSMTVSRPDWPATVRMTGKDWNQDITYKLRDLCYESLLMEHPITKEFIPRLATHWQVSDDRMTFRYRINPQARFSDGQPVTAQDVVASYKLRMDPKTLDPSSIQTFSKLNEPVAVSKYILEVTCNEENWRNFLYFSEVAMTVFPASHVSIPGDEYLDTYQFSFVPGTGPYMVSDEDIDMGKSITARRRDDWWDNDNPAWEGLYNIGEIKWVVIADNNLEFEKFKAGEIDMFVISKAQWFVEEVPKLDAYKRGMIRRMRIFNDAPKGVSGIAINMTRPPLDDVRIRRALAYLYPRKLLLERFMFNQYEPINSSWPGGPYQNDDNVFIEYDPFRAVELLEEAGWTEKNAQGYRVKDGRELQFDLTYASQLFERYVTIYQEDCAKAGIRLELQLLTPAARWKNMRERKYDLTSTAWGAIDPPNPETSWHSKLAKQVDNNNITAFSNERVDELCTEYDSEYDPLRRIEIIKEIDAIVHAEQPYVHDWYNPAERFVVKNKFGIPKYGGMRMWDKDNIPLSWWVDPEKEAQLAACQADKTKTMQRGPEEYHFWSAWKQAGSPIGSGLDSPVSSQ